MDTLISRLEAVVGKLEGFTAKFCDGSDKSLPRSIISINESLQPALDNRDAMDKNRYKSDVAQLWHSSDMPDNTFPYWVSTYDGIISGPLAKFLKASQRIGDTVLTQAALVELVFRAQRQSMIDLAQKRNAGHLTQSNIDAIIQQPADKLSDVQKFRQQRYGSFYYNHLSTISESIPALNWMAVTSDTATFIQAMMDAGKFFSNRVLQDFREKNSIHIEWVNAWFETLAKIQSFVNEFHSTGVMWDSNKQDGDVLSRENVMVMTSHSVTEHKPAVLPRYREFSVNSVITSAPNHEVHVHPSQSAIYMSTPRKQPHGPSSNDKGAGGLMKRASNPETNPYQRRGYYDGVRHTSNEARDFSQNNSLMNSKRISSNAYDEISLHNRDQNSDYANEKDACPSGSYSNKTKKTSNQKNSALNQEFQFSSFHQARSDSQFNSSHSSFPYQLRSDGFERGKTESNLTPPYLQHKMAHSAMNPGTLAPQAQYKARPLVGPPNAKNVTAQSLPISSDPNSSSPHHSTYQETRKDSNFFPPYPHDQNSGYQQDSHSHYMQTTQQSHTQNFSLRADDQTKRQPHSATVAAASPSKSNLPADRNMGMEQNVQRDKRRDKAPRYSIEGTKWILENYCGVKDMAIEVEDLSQSVYISGCDDSVIKVIGKSSSIVIDSCNRTSVIFDETISGLKIIDCQKIQAQTLVKVPAVSVDQTDGCSVFLNRESINARILTSKSSAVNIIVPDEHGNYREYAIPEQFCTQWNGDQLITDDGRVHN